MYDNAEFCISYLPFVHKVSKVNWILYVVLRIIFLVRDNYFKMIVCLRVDKA